MRDHPFEVDINREKTILVMIYWFTALERIVFVILRYISFRTSYILASRFIEEVSHCPVWKNRRRVEIHAYSRPSIYSDEPP